MTCDCRIGSEEGDNQVFSINFCPLHAAAEEMREALTHVQHVIQDWPFETPEEAKAWLAHTIATGLGCNCHTEQVGEESVVMKCHLHRRTT